MKSLIKKSAKDIKDKLRDNLISLYLVGTAATSDRIVGDLDFFAVIKEPVNEESINKYLEENYDFEIRIRTILLDELKGKKKNATPIMQFGIFTVPELAEIFRLSKLVAGKQLNFKKLDGKEYIEFQIKKANKRLKRLNEMRGSYYDKNFFHKYVGYVVRAEIFYKKNKFIMGYEGLSNELKNNKGHIVHDIILIRKKKKRLSKRFLKKAELYLKEMGKLSKNI